MRSFCLLALTVGGMMVVVADLASGLEDPSAPDAGLAEHTNVIEVQRTASDVWKPQDEEERAFYIESLAAKLAKLLKSVKTKLAILYTSFFKSSSTKIAGMEHDADFIIRKNQVAPAVYEHRIVPPSNPSSITPGKPPVAPGKPLMRPGKPPVAPGKPLMRPGKPPIAPGKPPVTSGKLPVTSGKPPVTSGKHYTTLAHKLHENQRFKEMWAEVRKSDELKQIAEGFRKFSKNVGGETKAAQVVHKKLQAQLSEQAHNHWSGFQEVQYTWWVHSKMNPADVETMVKNGGGKDVEVIAREIAEGYMDFLQDIWSHIHH